VVITGTGSLPPPAPSTIDIDLQVTAPNPATAADPLDPCADLVIEPVPRPSSPPLPGELDNPVLRGTATPAGYSLNTAVVPVLTVPVGAATYLTDPIPFAA